MHSHMTRCSGPIPRTQVLRDTIVQLPARLTFESCSALLAHTTKVSQRKRRYEPRANRSSDILKLKFQRFLKWSVKARALQLQGSSLFRVVYLAAKYSHVLLQ